MEERFTRKTARKDIDFADAVNRFISFQKGKGNAPATVSHYENTIKKLSEFFCWLVFPEKYLSMSDEDRIKTGMEQKVSVFDRDGIECDFRTFLSETGNLNEVPVNTYFRDYRAIAYWLADSGFIEGHKITIRTVEPRIKEVYSDEEIARLLKKPKADCTFSEYRNWVVIHHLRNLHWQSGLNKKRKPQRQRGCFGSVVRRAENVKSFGKI